MTVFIYIITVFCTYMDEGYGEVPHRCSPMAYVALFSGPRETPFNVGLLNE